MWRAGLLLMLALGGCRQSEAPPLPLAAALASLRAPDPASRIDCASLVKPLVLLVMGQSNAGNHGSGTVAQPATHILAGKDCYTANDPLPGATGSGASVWTRLPAIHGRPLLLVPVVVESTRIAQWLEAGPLREHLETRLHELAQGPFKVDLVLWQQGEADARAGTPQTQYLDSLASLRVLLDAQGIRAPLVAARSTYCPGSDGGAVRAAIAGASGIARIVEGPDFDVLQGDMRSGGCHFSEPGLTAAARLWTGALSQLVDP